MVYTQDISAFEAALQDVMIRMSLGRESNILLGAADELTEENYNLKAGVGQWKVAEETNLNLLNSKSKGTIPGEGATFMVASDNKENAELELVGVELFHRLNKGQSFEERTSMFLQQYNYSISDIDAVILANDGDYESDKTYSQIADQFKETCNVLYYKHICGSHHSDGAFALWMASKIVQTGVIPEYALIHPKVDRRPNVTLLVKQRNGKSYSFVLVRGIK